MGSRLPHIWRRCRRAGTQLLCVAVAIACTHGVPAGAGASSSLVPAAFALPATPAAAEPGEHAHVATAVTAPPSITARVVANGAPVAEADVSISDGSTPRLATARTDRDGVVHFAALAPGAYELWAARGDTASSIARVMDVAPDSRVELALDRPAARVQGRVVVAAAEPRGVELPADAFVQLVPQDLDHALRVAAVARDGTFSVDSLPYGRWRVEVSAHGHVRLADQTLVVASAEPAPIAVHVQRTGTITGTVVDSAGTPVTRATLVLRDRDGAFVQRPTTLAATRMRWVHPLAGTRHLPPNEHTNFGARRAGQRPAECGRGHCGVDLFDARGSIVHAVADGTIVALYPEGRGEAGRLVAVHHGGGLRSLYMHLDEIRPGLEVGQTIRAGDPVGTLGSTGFFRSAPHLHFAITHDHDSRTWYLDPEPMLRTAVVLPVPRPFDPVDGGVTAPSLVAAPTPSVTSITTDAQGRFRIDDVAPGSYVAAAFASGWAPGVSPPFDVPSGQLASGITIRLSPGVLVGGRVVGRDGPLANATVVAVAGMGETAAKIATTTTDRHGEYTLRALAGAITLVASAPSHGDAERRLALAPGRDHQREDFTLTAEDGALRGVALAPDGGAAAGVSVRIVEGTTRRRTVSDAFGRFTIAPVASGRYVVELSSPEHPSKRVAIDTQRFAELRLDRGGGARALVRDSHSGAPLPSLRIQATSPTGQSLSRQTDARGQVELRGLAPGAWTVTVRAPGYLAASRSLIIRAGSALDDTTFDLVRGATLAGEVRDRYGRRVAGARVSLGDVSATTDADGSFRLTGVASGTLEADSEGRHAALDLRLSPGDERLTLTITLSE